MEQLSYSDQMWNPIRLEVASNSSLESKDSSLSGDIADDVLDHHQAYNFGSSSLPLDFLGHSTSDNVDMAYTPAKRVKLETSTESLQNLHTPLIDPIMKLEPLEPSSMHASTLPLSEVEGSFLDTLTVEERQMMEREGVTIPAKGPLTKAVERELKRLRRKIKNKLSAQDSRRRRKEYVGSIEEANKELKLKLKQVAGENKILSRQLSILSRMSSARARCHQIKTGIGTSFLMLCLSAVAANNPDANVTQSVVSADGAELELDAAPILPKISSNSTPIVIEDGISENFLHVDTATDTTPVTQSTSEQQNVLLREVLVRAGLIPAGFDISEGFTSLHGPVPIRVDSESTLEKLDGEELQPRDTNLDSFPFSLPQVEQPTVLPPTVTVDYGRGADSPPAIR